MWSLAMPIALALLPLPLFLSRFLPPVQDETHALRLPPSIAEKLKAEQRLPAAGIARTVLRWLVWVGLVFALADPRMALTTGALPASGRDIMLVLDFSGSMLEQDFTLDGKAARRVDALKHFAREFILRRSGDRIGLVVFASAAYVAAPLSFDLAGVSHALDDVSVELMGRSKTAIGDGLGLALKRLRESHAPTRLVILESDGANDAGSAKPVPVAHLAKALGIRVDTIALGPQDLANPGEDQDPVDAATLKAIASVSGGHAFRAHSTKELEEVSHSIDQLEGGPAKAPPAVIYDDRWIYPASLAFLAVFAVLILDWRRP